MESRHKVLWVEPKDTKRTRLDEITDRVCWPCTKHMTKGTCGSVMKRHFVNSILLDENEITKKEYAVGFLDVIKCWKENKQEYGATLKRLPESEISWLERTAAEELHQD